MFQLTIAAFLLPLAAGAFVPFNGGKIVGGQNTSIEQVPYQVAIEIEGLQSCGGSIITARHILSAGHCFFREDLTKISIRAGSTFLETGGTVINASKVVTHPKFNFNYLDYDVAVIELEEDIELSETSQIIGVADEEPSAGTAALVSGWGRQDLADGPSDILQSVIIPVVDRQKCVEFYEEDGDEWTVITDRMICAGGEEKGGCKGDSGGALVVRNKSGERVVAGITSWGGSGCGKKGVFDVYENVANPEIRSFIREQAGV